MRLALLLPAATCALVMPATIVHGQTDARQILEKAIKANGGEEKLTRLRAARVKVKGKLEVAGGVDFTQQISYSLPDKFREEMTLDVGGKQVKVTTVINGDKAAIDAGGMKVPINETIKKAIQDARNMAAVSRLVGLKAREYELSALGETKVQGKDAVGIRVSKKGAKEVNLYFDKKTSLLTKIEHRTVDAMSGNEVTEERIVLDYQTVDGLPAPRRVLMNRDGKRFLEAEVLEVRFLEAIADGEFSVD